MRANSAGSSIKRNGGFTLMEMLIVIAIIAVLIAIAIPLFTSQLNAAKQATDESNARSLFAQVQANYMLKDSSGTWDEPEAAQFPGKVNASKAVISYDGSTFTFSDVCEELTYTAPTNSAGPKITLQSNGKKFIFPDSPSGVEGYGSTWRNLVSGLNTIDNKNWEENRQLYADVKAVDNGKRVKSDIDVLQSISHFFEGKTEAQLKEIFGDKYSYFENGKAYMLFRYRIDNTSNSIHFDYVKGSGYFEDLGYVTTDVNGNAFSDKDRQYASTYLLTSDEIIDKIGIDNDIMIQLTMKDGKVSSAHTWVKDSETLDSDK